MKKLLATGLAALGFGLPGLVLPGLGLPGLGLTAAAAAPSSKPSSTPSSADYSEAQQKQALEIYRTAISMRTVKGEGKTPALAAYLANQFREGGFAEEDVRVLSFSETPDPTAALVVRYRGDGSSGEKPILLLAHMDVVEARREDWERDPFTLIEEDGYFFARGSLDNKFGVSTLTSTFLRLKAEGFTPTRDLIIAFTGDEETGMLTTQALVDKHRSLTDAEFALNADAGGGALDPRGDAVAYFIQGAEKTYATFELTARNPGGHSSAPRADNAIYDLTRALQNLSAYKFPVRTNDLTRAFFRDMSKLAPHELGAAMARFAENPQDKEASDLLATQPEFVGVTRTTCVTTMLRGGHAENALPQSATATVNCRIFPGVEISEIKSALAKVVDNDAIEITVLGDPKAGPASPMREDVMTAVRKAVHARYPDLPVMPLMAPYATDGYHLRRAGIPTYGVMGVFIKEDEVFAHGLNERVPVKTFFEALDHWRTILTELAGPGDDASGGAGVEQAGEQIEAGD